MGGPLVLQDWLIGKNTKLSLTGRRLCRSLDSRELCIFKSNPEVTMKSFYHHPKYVVGAHQRQRKERSSPLYPFKTTSQRQRFNAWRTGISLRFGSSLSKAPRALTQLFSYTIPPTQNFSHTLTLFSHHLVHSTIWYSEYGIWKDLGSWTPNKMLNITRSKRWKLKRLIADVNAIKNVFLFIYFFRSTEIQDLKKTPGNSFALTKTANSLLRTRKTWSVT